MQYIDILQWLINIYINNMDYRFIKHRSREVRYTNKLSLVYVKSNRSSPVTWLLLLPYTSCLPIMKHHLIPPYSHTNAHEWFFSVEVHLAYHMKNSCILVQCNIPDWKRNLYHIMNITFTSSLPYDFFHSLKVNKRQQSLRLQSASL